MTESMLLSIINSGEGPAVEFKREFTTELVRDTAAFANCGGGNILIGVDDEANIVGIGTEMRSLEERVMGLCAHNLKPALTPTVESVSSGGENILVISVPDGMQKPYTANDVCYVRAGSTSRRAQPDELRRLSLASDYTVYERIPVTGTTFLDLDIGALEMFIQKRAPGAVLINGLQLQDVAITLQLAVKHGGDVIPTVVGLMSFGRNPQLSRPEWGLSAVRVAGETLDAPILDRADVEGSVTQLVDGALSFVKRNMRVAAIWNDEHPAQRIDLPEYPLAAVRETIVNATAHRDYSTTSRIALRLYENRLEVLNPGALLPEVELDMLLNKGGSFPRNPTLCRLMREFGLTEEIGRGLLRIQREMSELGSAPPVFEQTSQGFSVTLPSRHNML